MSRRILLSGVDAQQVLRRFLNPREPAISRAALRLWKAQAGMVEEKDLAECLAGVLPEGLLLAWKETTEEFVWQQVAPALEAGFESADKAVVERLRRLQGKSLAILTRAQVQQWADSQAGKLVVELSEETRRVMTEILRGHLIKKPLSPFEISKMIESHVGLTSRYSAAVTKRYQDMVAAGASPEKAMKEMERYAQFLKRNRAMTIARNELAEAYGEGQFQAMREASLSGAVNGQMKKTWATADDERTCPICQGLDGEQRDLEQPFSCGRQRPPAHITCRCCSQYEVIGPN